MPMMEVETGQPNTVATQALNGRILVEELTTSGLHTFECFRLFQEKAGKKKRWPKDNKKTFQVIKLQSSTYSKTIATSLKVAEFGTRICRDMVHLLSNGSEPLPAQAKYIKSYAEIAHGSAVLLQQAFGNIRGTLLALQRHNIHYESINDGLVDLQRLRNLEVIDLVPVIVCVVAGLASTAGKFSEWWWGLKIDLSRVSDFAEKPGMGAMPKEVWEKLEGQYSKYSEEIGKQEACYRLSVRPESKGRKIRRFFEMK